MARPPYNTDDGTVSSLAAIAGLALLGVISRRRGSLAQPGTLAPGRLERLDDRIKRVYQKVFQRIPTTVVEDLGAETPPGMALSPRPIPTLLVDGAWAITAAPGRLERSPAQEARGQLLQIPQEPERWGWFLERVVSHPGTRWEPPSEDYEGVGWYATDGGVIYEIVCEHALEGASVTLEEIQWQELARAQEQSRPDWEQE